MENETGAGMTEKLTPEMNTQPTVIQSEQENSSKKKGKKSESNLQLIKRSLFYSKKKENEKFVGATTNETVKRKRAAKSIQNAIGYELMYENGLCYLGDGKYSVTIGFDDINYQSANKDDQLDIFQKYCEVLEYYSPDVKVQVSIIHQ